MIEAFKKLPRWFIVASVVSFMATMSFIHLSRAQRCTVELQPSGWHRTVRAFTRELACDRAMVRCKFFVSGDETCVIRPPTEE